MDRGGSGEESAPLNTRRSTSSRQASLGVPGRLHRNQAHELHSVGETTQLSPAAVNEEKRGRNRRGCGQERRREVFRVASGIVGARMVLDAADLPSDALRRPREDAPTEDTIPADSDRTGSTGTTDTRVVVLVPSGHARPGVTFLGPGSRLCRYRQRPRYESG